MTEADHGPTLVTERLALAPLEDADADRLFAYRSDAEVCRFQTWEPKIADDARAFIAAVRSVPFATPGAWSQLGIRLRDSGALVGDVGVHVGGDEPWQAEIGFTVAPDAQGRGIATEAVRALLGHLFAECGMHRVFASVDPRNEASMALLRRVGMRQEAHFRQSLMFKGAWADDVVFAVLASEWSEAAAG